MKNLILVGSVGGKAVQQNIQNESQVIINPVFAIHPGCLFYHEKKQEMLMKRLLACWNYFYNIPTEEISKDTLLDLLKDHETRIAAHSSASMPTADEISDLAKSTMDNRAKEYDAPSGERSMAKTVAAFNTYYGHNLSELDGWNFMRCLKMARESQGDFKLDNYVDGTAYSALAGECAAKMNATKTQT